VQKSERHKYRTATVQATNQLRTKTGFPASNESNAYIIPGVNEIYICWKRSCLYNFINVWHGLFTKSFGMSFQSLEHL